MTFVSIILLVGAIVICPFIIERQRLEMNKMARADAPGFLVRLERGVTHYRTFGQNDAPLVVCIHGLTTPCFVFEALAKAYVDKGYRVLTYDHYGRGYSDRPKGAQNRDFFVKHLKELLEVLGEQGEFDLIGYSMGAWIATAFAADHPNRVNRLILIAPAGMGANLGWTVKFASNIYLLGDWLFMAVFAYLHRRNTQKDRVKRSYVDFVVDRQQKELIYRGFLPSVLSSLRGVLSSSSRSDHHLLWAHKSKVLAIWGKEDDVIPLSYKDKMAKWNGHAKHIVVIGADHGLPYTHVPQIMDAIDQAC